MDAEIRLERVRAMFRQAPLGAAVTAANAILMTAVLAGVEHLGLAYAWLAVVLLVAALRLLLWAAYARAMPAPEAVDAWAIAGTLGAGVAGLLWGGGAVILSPPSEIYELLWIFLIGGMCAGAAALHFAYLPAALAFMLPACLPVAVRFAVVGPEPRFVAAAMIAVFVAALGVIAWQSSRHFGDIVRLRLDLLARTDELNAANDRLRAEMAERRATEASLRHTQKMEAVGQLTGGIAHDFNNLLTAVLGSLGLLRRRLPATDPAAARLLGIAEQAAERGAALTQRLLAFGRRQALRPEVAALPAVVHGISALLRSTLGPGIRVEMRFPEALGAVGVDVNQLELALLNLASNARDAMPRGGELAITAREETLDVADAGGLPAGAYVVLAVADTGEGMDETTLARAEEPFFTTKDTGRGTGLGLAMVHGLAAQSGGRLVLRSRKGEGTVAELWLPRIESPRGTPIRAAKPAPTAAGGGRRVLLVDDDPAVLATTAAMLEDLGHAVIAVASPREALDALGGAAVELAITDYAMPGMTGADFAEALKRLRPGLPVLLVTGYAELPETTAGLPRLAKPFSQPALARAITQCLAEADSVEGGLS